MKTLCVALIAVCAMVIRTNAQIPNSGFENWTTVGSYEEPTGWATSDSFSTGPFYAVTKSTDHDPANAGSYSIRLENNTSLTQMTGGWGLALTGKRAYNKPSFAIVGHPDSLCGYYQYNSLNNDSMAIGISLYENGIMIYNHHFITGITTSTWTPFTLPLDYTSADSATIMLMAFNPSSQTSGPKGNSVLYVDNLSFTNSGSAVRESPARAMGRTAFCSNAVKNRIFFSLPNAKLNQQVTVAIYNSYGQIALHKTIAATENSIDISHFSPGSYVMVLNRNGEKISQRVVKME